MEKEKAPEGAPLTIKNNNNKTNISPEEKLKKIKDPELRETLKRIYTKIQSKNFAEYEELKLEIESAPPPKPEQMKFSFLPQKLAKVSIFFPMSDKELKEERRRISRIENETSWGKVIVEGIKLAIFEEDILLSLFILLGKYPSNLQKFEEGFLLETNLMEIARILYFGKSYSKETYNRILNTLRHFQLVRFEIITDYWKKEKGEKIRMKKIRSIGGIISGFKYDEKTKNIQIYFNPLFMTFFLSSFLIPINFTIRRKLKRDGSKALLRFLRAHTKPQRMHILTILKAINYNIDQPLYLLRRKFKQFVSELKKHKILGPKTQIYPDDTVYFDLLKNDS